MAKTLFLFLLSDRVDAYVNSIARCFDVHQIEAVRLVHVGGDKAGLTEKRASAIYNGIWFQIQSLSRGIYTEPAKGGWECGSRERPLIEPRKTDIYERINERLLDRQLLPLDHADLKRGLGTEIKRQGGRKQCIIDLGGETKAGGIDVFAVSLALGLDDVYTFELKNRVERDAPEKYLYHALDEGVDYEYVRLTDSDPVRDSRASLMSKSRLAWIVGALGLIVMAVSFYLIFSARTSSPFLHGLNIVASIVTILSASLAALVSRR